MIQMLKKTILDLIIRPEVLFMTVQRNDHDFVCETCQPSRFQQEPPVLEGISRPPVFTSFSPVFVLFQPLEKKCSISQNELCLYI